MEDKNQLLLHLETFLGEGTNTSRENWAFHCPVCNHEKKKLEVDLASYQYHCWTCLDPPTKGRNFIYLLLRLGAGKRVIDRVKSYMNRDLLNQWLYSKEDTSYKVQTYKDITLPKEYKSFYDGYLDSTGRRLYRYLRETRNLSDDVIKAFKIGYCSTGKYFNRIILPVFNSTGKVCYFNARSISNVKGVVKYYDPLEKGSSAVKRSIVPMSFFIDTSKPVVLVEGLFDFYNTPNSIPLMGTTIFSGVLQYLLSPEIREIVICLDAGTTPKIIRYGNMLKSFGKEVSFIRLEGDDDPGSLDYNKMRKHLKNTTELNDIEILKIQLYG